MFGKRKKNGIKTDKELIKLAKRYLKVLETSDFLPKNSREMYEVIKKAGLR